MKEEIKKTRTDLEYAQFEREWFFYLIFIGIIFFIGMGFIGLWITIKFLIELMLR
jgi:hypothetical protein